jgi:alpha-galactosidase
MFNKGFLVYKVTGKSFETAFDTLSGPNRFEHGIIQVENKSANSSSLIKITLMSDLPVTIEKFYIEANYRFNTDDKIFCNGYQSWTDSREFAIDEKMKPMWKLMGLVDLDRIGDYLIYPYSGKKGRLHAFGCSYIRKNDQRILFIGSISEDSGYTFISHDVSQSRIRIEKDCKGYVCSGEYRAFDIAVLEGGEDAVYDEFLRLGKTARPKAKPAAGWTSWYNYFMDINQDIIMSNLESFEKHRIPIDVFQIDGGWYSFLGDWLIEKKCSFPGGMKYLADEIKKRGITPGLWLGPFVCEKDSRLFKDHPEFLLKNEHGEPIPTCWQPRWFKGSAECDKMYALNLCNKDFREYLKEVFHTVTVKWGYEMLKLDFLYSAAIVPHSGRTRGEIMADAMKFMREIAGDKIILGCGVPLSASFGLVDYCRIGSDVSVKWEDAFTKLIHNRERPSTINSLVSTIGRRHFNSRFFLNDPDVFLMRSNNNKMNDAQKFTLFFLNNLFGSLVFTSDNISEYSEKEMRIYRSMFPLKEKRILSVNVTCGLYEIMFEIDDKSYLAFSNTGSKTRRVMLPEGQSFTKNPAGSEGEFINGDGFTEVKAYETKCFLKIGPDFSIAGSTGHIFPGSEVASLESSGETFTIKLEEKFIGEGYVYIKVSADGNYIVNGETVQSFKACDGIFIIKIHTGDLND